MDWRHSTHCGGGECVEVTYDWRKSSYSSDSFNCIEVTWRRSTRCDSGRCVEVVPGSPVLVRDSKLGDASPILAFAPAAWTSFLEGIKDGRRIA